jgi:hypothetical protein
LVCNGLTRFGVAMALAGMALSAPILAPDVSAQTSCDPSYPDFCISPVWEAGDLDCSDVAETWFTVIQPDGHGFDADFDGYGCESV